MHLSSVPFKILRENDFQALYEGPIITMTTLTREFLAIGYIPKAFMVRFHEVLKLPIPSI